VLTGGNVPPLDMNRPEADPENELIIVADKLVSKEKRLATMPDENPFLTVNFCEELRGKARRGKRALFHRLSKERLEYLCGEYEQIPRRALIELLDGELQEPGSQKPYREPDAAPLETPKPPSPQPSKVPKDPETVGEHCAELVHGLYGPSILEPKKKKK